jgi:DNA (cytosine-5)-methyltransferase 1
LIRPRALDLFCGAGGASMGLHRAGFDVVGVDINPQPRYPFAFVQGDALAPSFDLDGFELIWASPPCQAFSAYRRRRNHVAACENLIPAARQMLALAARTVIENVPGSPLRSPIELCGSMFGLNVRRHRWFETSWPILTPPCDHASQQGDYPAATNRLSRKTVEVGAWRIPLETQQQAMAIDWMRLTELSQAIPPAYSEFIGRAALRYIEQGRAA